MKNPIIIAVVIALVVGAGAFFGGMKYQETRRGNAFTQGDGSQNHGQFQGGEVGNRTGFRPVSGEITSQDDASITVKLEDGSSKIIILSDKTAINKESTGEKSDLKTGERVAVFGTNNSDGSVTAQNIQLNPGEGFGGGNGADHQGNL